MNTQVAAYSERKSTSVIAGSHMVHIGATIDYLSDSSGLSNAAVKYVPDFVNRAVRETVEVRRSITDLAAFVAPQEVEFVINDLADAFRGLDNGQASSALGESMGGASLIDVITYVKPKPIATRFMLAVTDYTRQGDQSDKEEAQVYIYGVGDVFGYLVEGGKQQRVPVNQNVLTSQGELPSLFTRDTPAPVPTPVTIRSGSALGLFSREFGLLDEEQIVSVLTSAETAETAVNYLRDELEGKVRTGEDPKLYPEDNALLVRFYD